MLTARPPSYAPSGPVGNGRPSGTSHSSPHAAHVPSFPPADGGPVTRSVMTTARPVPGADAAARSAAALPFLLLNEPLPHGC